jgi:hypothetical protein
MGKREASRHAAAIVGGSNFLLRKCFRALGVIGVSPSACFYNLENIGSVYPAMSMIVIGHLLLF